MLTRAASRAFSTAGLKVVNNVAKQQFLVTMQGKEATLEYQKRGKEITFVSTDVPEVFQGKGVGKLLAKHAFNYATDNKLAVTCKCHFLADFYKKNKKDYDSLKFTIDLDDEPETKKLE